MSNQTNSSGYEQSTDPLLSEKSPANSWGDVSLAALSFVLVLLGECLPMLLVELGVLTWEEAGMRILNIGLTVVLVGSLLAVFILAWRRKWPVWSATWYLFFCIPPLILAVGLSALLMQGQLDFTISQNVVIYVWVPLIIAVLLYIATRVDPLRGLLAALPVMYLLWQTNMEFVSDTIEIALTVVIIALICLAIAYVLRRGDWRIGLYAILAMNLAVGALFAYAGIYHGGTLPFTAPGPNLVEVLRSLIPQYLATSAIMLGPLFAWRFRLLGRSNGLGGTFAYHLALAGLLLVIMANLAGLSLMLEVDSPSAISNSMTPLVILGLGVYLVGVIWLSRYAALPRSISGWAEVILLPLLPLGIPIMLMLPFITWKWPVSSLYGIPLLWVLPHAISLALGLAWLVLSTWVITRDGGFSEPAASLQGASEAPVLSQ